MPKRPPLFLPGHGGLVQPNHDARVAHWNPHRWEMGVRDGEVHLRLWPGDDPAGPDNEAETVYLRMSAAEAANFGVMLLQTAAVVKDVRYD